MAKRIHIPAGTPLKERLTMRSKPGPNGCIDFVGSRDTAGYGQFRGVTNGKLVRAHRASYIVHVGTIPIGMQVLHRCDRRVCINPAHLWLGTNDDNVRDKITKGRGAATLTIEDVRNIRGDTRRQHIIAAEYGVTQSTVSHVKSRKGWRHVV